MRRPAMPLGSTRPPIDFSSRSDTMELMESEPCGYEDYRQCLRDLARVNQLTLAYRPTLAFVRALAAKAGDRRPLVIVDVGCGSGDMLRSIDRWAARHLVSVDLIGVDLDERAVRAAHETTARQRPIRWINGNCYGDFTDGGIDIVISSLFAHHLDDTGLIRFLAWMEGTARLGWFINDLHRHPMPYHLFRLWARLARWHRFVQHDGPVSITRAFVTTDWQRLLAAAGISPDTARIDWWIPFRLCVSRQRIS